MAELKSQKQVRKAIHCPCGAAADACHCLYLAIDGEGGEGLALGVLRAGGAELPQGLGAEGRGGVAGAICALVEEEARIEAEVSRNAVASDGACKEQVHRASDVCLTGPCKKYGGGCTFFCAAFLN